MLSFLSYYSKMACLVGILGSLCSPKLGGLQVCPPGKHINVGPLRRLLMAFVTMHTRGSLHTSQISHLLLHPSLRLLVPGLSSHFCHCFLYNLLLRYVALVGNILEKWLQDFVSFGNPCIHMQVQDCFHGETILVVLL